jgi:hypothetical protein
MYAPAALVVPGGHGLHVEGDDAPVVLLKVPGAHGVQLAEDVPPVLLL